MNIEALAQSANAAIRRDDLPAAVAALEQLVALLPDNAALRRQCSIALNNWGSRLLRQGESHAAQERLVRALALWPENVDALFNRARQCIEMRQYAAALEYLAPAARLKPDDRQIALELAECELACGDISALARVERALGPGDHARRASALVDAGRFDDAVACAGTSETAKSLLEAGAEDAGLRAYALAPGLPALLGAKLGLPAIQRSHETIAASRERYSRGLDWLHEHLDEKRLRAFDPKLEQLAWTNYLLAYHGEDDRALQARYGQLLERALRVFAPQWTTPPKPHAARARPRVGLVSSGFCHSTVGSYFGSWIGALAGGGCETLVFQLGPRFDGVTEALGRDAHALVKLDGDIASFARAIASAELDLVLYTDPMVDPRTAVLAGLRLAPRQLCAWGFPVTTGLASIDAYVSCAEMEPDDAASHYVEALRLLPGIGTAYRLPAAPASRTRAELGLPAGKLYIVPQAYQKLHPDGDAVLARIAALDRDARVLLFGAARAVATRALSARIGEAFDAAGADRATQLTFLAPVKRSRFLEILAACDVMVDGARWSGGNTTLDALRAGLPVVGCAGRFMRGRQTLAMLRKLGLGAELMVDDRDAIAVRAVELAADPARRARLREALRAGLPALVDGRAALAALVEHVHASCAPTR